MASKLFLIIVLITPIIINAQSTIASASSSVSSSEGAVSFSIGQVLYSTSSMDNASVSVGVQQAYEISLSTDIYHLKEIKSLHIFPNPFTDFIHIENKARTDWNYRFTDIYGEVVREGIVHQINEKIVVSDLTSGFYVLNFTNAANQYQSFKIIKH